MALLALSRAPSRGADMGGRVRTEGCIVSRIPSLKTSSVLGKAVRGAGWALLSGLGTRVLSLIGTLLLTRFLPPEVQGAVTASYIFVLTPHWMTTPLVQYLVAHPEEREDVGFHVTVAHLGIGFIVIVATVLLATPVGRYLNAPEMARYAPGFGVALALERVGTVAERVLARELRFRPIAASRAASELSYSIGSVALAALGFGGMAIVYGNIARGVAYAGIVVTASDKAQWLKPAPLRWSVFAKIFRYGTPLGIGYLATVISRRWDNLVVTKLYGTGVAGLYNLAYNLADVPALQVAEQIGDVFMPSLAHLPPDERKATSVRVAGLLAILVFPLAMGLGAVAPTVERIFSQKWAGVGPMLTILAVMSITRPIAVSIVSPYLQVTGQTRAMAVLGFAQIALLMGALFTLGRLGPLWACAAVGVAFGVYTLLSLAVLRAFEKVPISSMLLRCVPPLVACIPMVVAVRGLEMAMTRPGGEHPLWVGFELALEVVTGGVAYVGAAFVVARPLAKELIATIRSARQR